MLVMLGKQRGITPNLKVHERFDRSKGLRFISGLSTPLQERDHNIIYDEAIIEFLPSFAVYSMIIRNVWLRMVFNHLLSMYEGDE